MMRRRLQSGRHAQRRALAGRCRPEPGMPRNIHKRKGGGARRTDYYGEPLVVFACVATPRCHKAVPPLRPDWRRGLRCGG